MRAFGVASGSVGTPSVERLSNVMSKSMNWPKNVTPAVCVGVVGVRGRVVPVHRAIRDQGDRAGGEAILGVEQPTELPDVTQDVAELIGRARRAEALEERREVGEETAEVAGHGRVRPEIRPTQAHSRRDARRSGAAEPDAETGEERSPAVSTRRPGSTCFHARPP